MGLYPIHRYRRTLDAEVLGHQRHNLLGHQGHNLLDLRRLIDHSVGRDYCHRQRTHDHHLPFVAL